MPTDSSRSEAPSTGSGRPIYYAVQVMARLAPNADTNEIDAKIMAALGCDNTEDDCPMYSFASTSHSDHEKAFAWLTNTDTPR